MGCGGDRVGMGWGMGCRPEDGAEEDMARGSENGLAKRKPRLGGAEESKARVTGKARRRTTRATRRSEPPRPDWG